MTDHTAPADTHGEALDWLVGRLRWEKILRELHDRAEGLEPIAAAVEIPKAGDQAA